MTDTVRTALQMGYRPVPMRTINQRLVPFHYQHSGGTYGYDDLDLYKICRTFALVLLDCVLIDVDAHKDGADLASIKRDLAALFDMSVSDLDDHILQDQISRQSIHYLMRLPEDVDFTSINQHNHGRLINYVDFKVGRQLVYIRDAKRQHWRHIDDLHRIDSATVYKIFGRRVAVIDDPDVAEFAALVRRESRSRDDVISMIPKCDPDCDYDTWIRIGMAVASWDSSDEGLRVWDDWSAGGESYQVGECAIKWRSFGSVGGVTLGTLVHLSNAATQNDMITETQRICNNILTSDYNQLRKLVIRQLAESDVKQLNDFAKKYSNIVVLTIQVATSPTAWHDVGRTRRIRYELLQEEDKVSISSIGRVFGQDHTTVLHSLNNKQNKSRYWGSEYSIWKEYENLKTELLPITTS